MEPAVEERHATWLELFFDLVGVPAVWHVSYRRRGAADPGPEAA